MVKIDYTDLENTIGRLLKTTNMLVGEINGRKVILTSDFKYMKVHEYGALIEAKNQPYLKFQYRGRWVTKRSVQIPARPTMNPAVQDSVEEVKKILANTVAMAVTGTPEQAAQITDIEMKRVGDIVVSRARKNAVELLYSSRGMLSGNTGLINTGHLADSMRAIMF